MKLLSDRILVEPIPEKISKGGIILPTRGPKKLTGVITLVGIKVKKLKVGDTIMYLEHSGESIDDSNRIVLRESKDVISITGKGTSYDLEPVMN